MDPTVTTRRPCRTCPWRVSTQRGDYPGGGVDAAGLLAMIDNSMTIMQCHNTPDGPGAKACVGFVLQVGEDHAGVRWLSYRSGLQGETFGTDAPLRSVTELIDLDATDRKSGA